MRFPLVRVLARQSTTQGGWWRLRRCRAERTPWRAVADLASRHWRCRHRTGVDAPIRNPSAAWRWITVCRRRIRHRARPCPGDGCFGKVIRMRQMPSPAAPSRAGRLHLTPGSCRRRRYADHQCPNKRCGLQSIPNPGSSLVPNEARRALAVGERGISAVGADHEQLDAGIRCALQLRPWPRCGRTCHRADDADIGMVGASRRCGRLVVAGGGNLRRGGR